MNPLLPDSDLDPELLRHAQSVRQFAETKLLPHARRIDEECTFRSESVAELASAGILGGTIDKAYGGQGWSPMQLAIAHEEIGAVCTNTRGFLAVHGGLVAHSFVEAGDEALSNELLPRLASGELIGSFGLTEEEAGSDVASLSCRATPDGDGYRLGGKKIWNTNGTVADVCIVFATLDPAKGKDAITAFVVDLEQEGVVRAPMPGKELGHRGSSHAELVFDGAFAPKSRMLGKPGQGFTIALSALSAGRLSVSAGAVGIHRAALQASCDFVRKRKQFGKPLAAFQMVQERIADMTTELLAARQLVHRCARRRAAGTETPVDVAAAKLYATEAAARAADTAVMLHGGRGYTTEYPVERLLRDIMGLRIYEGTSMIQKLILARSVLS